MDDTTKDRRAGTETVKITVGILDDDLSFVVTLEETVKAYFDQYRLDAVIDCYSDPKELEQGEKKYDLLFLDIVMPGKDGISLLNSLRKEGRVRDAIYVSGHDCEVFRTFESRPIAYVRKQCLEEDMEKAMALYHEHLKTVLVMVPEGKKTHLLRMDDIIYVSSQNHYVEFHMWDGTSLIIRSKLDNIEAFLGRHGFVRVHVSYLINLKYILSIDRTKVHLKNRKSLKISLKYKKQVFETLKDHFSEI